MKENFPNWLSKKMVKGVRGFNLDAYLVALEGWRRGLTLRWYYDAAEVTDMKIIGFNPLGKTFSLTSNKTTHFFYRSRGDKVTNEAIEIVSNKHQTKKLLSEANVPNPEGFIFNVNDDPKDIIKSALMLGFPLVIKPVFGSLGKGVITNIQTEDALHESLILTKKNEEYVDFLIERYTPGFDLRVYVAGDKVLGAIKRIPANVNADGINSIQELIKFKNIERKKSPHLAAKLISIDEEMVNYLKQQEITLDTIPDKNTIIYLTGKSNISAGGDSVDYTDKISPEAKETAIRAVNSIPGLAHAGVDLIINENDVTVIEINGTADIIMHLFPLIGRPRNIPEGIIDYYYPETKEMAKDRTKIYFDYKEINELQLGMLIKEIQLPDAPKGKMYAKRYVVSGKVQKVGYRNFIRREARKQNLNGYTRNLRNGEVVVVVGSDDKIKVSNFKKVCDKGPRRAKVNDVQEYVWENTIRLGFEIRDTR